MIYDIVPFNSQYRGMGRVLKTTDLYTKQSKKEYDYLLDKYFEYLSLIQNNPSTKGMDELIGLYNEFLKYEIKCEVIVYSHTPLKDAFGYDLEFLGIDIVHRMAESLLKECTKREVRDYLNENGLLSSLDHFCSIVLLLEHGNLKWEPCYIYKIKL